MGHVFDDGPRPTGQRGCMHSAWRVFTARGPATAALDRQPALGRDVRSCSCFFQAEDGIRDYKVTRVQTCALPIQAEDGIRDYKVTGVQTCALPIQAEDGIRDYKVTGVQTCAL